MQPRRQSRIERSLDLSPTGVKSAVTQIEKMRQAREVSINFDHHYSSKVFHPGSVVTGDLVVTPTRDVEGVSMQISLVGRARVYRDDVNGRQTVVHNFLGLDMPIPESAYPQSGVMEKGQTYRIPFNFTIPFRLLPSACARNEAFDGISDYHLQLPPTVGGWEKDDMSPEVVKISYAVTASIHQGESLRKVMEISKSIKVLGSSFEDPPLNVTAKDDVYKLKRTKKVRSSLLSRSTGKITAMADQPTAFYLDCDGRVASQSATNINLFFEPSAPGTAPPEIETVSAKIRAYTWYSAQPMQTLPNFGKGLGAYSTTVPVTTERITTAWMPSLGKLDDFNNDKGIPMAQTQAVQVSFTLPSSKKTFIPTFHSCLSSRIYAIELKLKVGGQSMALALPVQVVTEGLSVFKEQIDILPKFDDL